MKVKEKKGQDNDPLQLAIVYIATLQLIYGLEETAEIKSGKVVEMAKFQ